jgi:hypothetical protein
MFDQLSAEIPASLIKGFLTTTKTRTTTTKQNVDPAVHFVYSRVKSEFCPNFSFGAYRHSVSFQIFVSALKPTIAFTIIKINFACEKHT